MYTMGVDIGSASSKAVILKDGTGRYRLYRSQEGYGNGL